MPSDDSKTPPPRGPQDRIDALGEAPRGHLFDGELLSTKPDHELQRLVEEAARVAGTPIALVTMITDRLQLFRAHTGLPDEARATLATDRDASFCQFVVRDDALFEVNDAAHDARVPQHLVDAFGIASYLGVPLRSDEGTLGSLCVIDVTAREFSEEQRARLEELARRVERRLDQMKATRRTSRSTEPVFAELRNLLTPMIMSVDSIEVTLAEAMAYERHLAYAREAGAGAHELARGGEALRELMTEFTSLTEHFDELVTNLDALQDAVCDTGSACYLPRVLDTVGTLTHHLTKVSGGLTRPESPERWTLNASLGDLSSTLSVAVNTGASILLEANATHRLDLLVSASPEDELVHFDLSCAAFSEADLSTIERETRDVMPVMTWTLTRSPSHVRLSVPLLTR
jgi:GAF domain-containing protein